MSECREDTEGDPEGHAPGSDRPPDRRLYQGLQPERHWPSENVYAKYGTFSWWVERAKQMNMEEAASEKAA